MKTVAIVAPQFSPCSYPPAIRVRFFTNHLKEFGWQPVVLTVEPKYMEEPPDWEFARMISNDLEIIRVKGLPAKWTRKIGVGDLGIRCFPYMLRELRSLCKKQQVDALLIPGPPWHTFLLGPKAKREFSVPFVIDYIDPWISSWGEDEPFWKKAFWYRRMAIWLEPYALRQVDHVTAVSEGTNERVRSRYPFLQPSQFTAIPYGGEPGDFDYLRMHPRPNPYWNKKDGNFHFAYVGAMLPKAYETLRGLFSALLLLREENKALYERLRFHFLGTTYDPDAREKLVMPMAKEMGVEDVVSEHPKRIPYLDAINVLCDADAILAIGTSEPHYTASKIFPCILANRPLLAIYHETSSVVEILRKTEVGSLVTYSDDLPVGKKVPEVFQKLVKVITAGNNNSSLEMGLFERFKAHSMTSTMADVLNKVS
jgi:hypothetical protein